MPEEPDITDMQRKMRTLESRLAKEKETNKALRGERTKQKRRVGTLERQKDKVDKQVDELKTGQKESNQRLKACEEENKQLSKEIRELKKREDSLIEENRKLATRLETIDQDLNLFREKAEQAAEDIQSARKETADKLTAKFNKDRKALENEREELKSELSLLSKQLQQKGKVPLLPPEKVAHLMGDLVNRLGSRMPGMKLSTGQIKLKVAFGDTGEISGFFIPTPDADQALKESLHDLTLDFDRAAPFGTEPIPPES